MEANLVFGRMNQKVRAKRHHGAKVKLPGGTALIIRQDGAGPVMEKAQFLRHSGGSVHVLGHSKEELRLLETVPVPGPSEMKMILGPGTTPIPQGRGRTIGSGHAMKAAVGIGDGPNEGQKEKRGETPRAQLVWASGVVAAGLTTISIQKSSENVYISDPKWAKYSGKWAPALTSPP